MTRVRARNGFTLVELLVVMAIIAALSALALMIAPAIANQDNTLKGTADVQATLKIAQGLAAAAKNPRGVRFLSQTPSTNPASTANPPINIVTQLQYLESPPVVVSNPQVLVPGAFGGDTDGTKGPRVVFTYTPATSGANKGAITGRQCLIANLTADQAAQIVVGSYLILPTLNAYTRISQVNPATAVNPKNSVNSTTVQATLDAYPDAAFGAGTSYQTYHFGVYAPPRPLLGEPTVELPLSIGVDLTLSSPVGALDSTGTEYQNYDIMFAPNGQRLGTTSVGTSVLGGGQTRGGNNQVFLWVRDYTRNNFAAMPSAHNAALAHGFQKGGEQQIVGIRGAAIGTAPAMWPQDMVNGTYSTGNQYTLAQQKLTGQ